MKPSLPTTSLSKQGQLIKEDKLSKLRFVKVQIKDSALDPPPRGI